MSTIFSQKTSVNGLTTMVTVKATTLTPMTTMMDGQTTEEVRLGFDPFDAAEEPVDSPLKS
jgi:hypothetical protein